MAFRGPSNVPADVDNSCLGWWYISGLNLGYRTILDILRTIFDSAYLLENPRSLSTLCKKNDKSLGGFSKLCSPEPWSKFESTQKTSQKIHRQVRSKLGFVSRKTRCWYRVVSGYSLVWFVRETRSGRGPGRIKQLHIRHPSGWTGSNLYPSATKQENETSRYGGKNTVGLLMPEYVNDICTAVSPSFFIYISVYLITLYFILFYCIFILFYFFRAMG